MERRTGNPFGYNSFFEGSLFAVKAETSYESEDCFEKYKIVPKSSIECPCDPKYHLCDFVLISNGKTPN